MSNDEEIVAMLDKRAEERQSRRDFFRKSGGMAAGLATLSLLSACGDDDDGNDYTPIGGCTPTPSPTPGPTPTPGISDASILNFALNLEYLEANFYHLAVFGTPIDDSLMGGAGGSPGEVMGGAQITFSSPAIAAFAREIAGDELAHVTFLRDQLGDSAVAMPQIDLRGDSPDSAFSAAARAAGLIGNGQAFNPYENEVNFLLAAFIFEDVGVTAYKGAAPLISDKTYLEAAAGILAAEAYHAGLIRTSLYNLGVDARTAANAISDARDNLDGDSDIDQGITDGNDANIAPLDENGIAFSRTPEQVHNIVYLTDAAASQGGFFPEGTNGDLTESGDASSYD